MSCFREFVVLVDEDNVPKNLSSPLLHAIWKLHGDLSEFQTIDEAMTYVNTWYIANVIMRSTTILLSALLFICALFKLLLETCGTKVTKQRKPGSKSPVPLFSIAAMRHPRFIRQSDRIFVLSFAGSISLTLFWQLGGFGCRNEGLFALVAYVACLAFEFHAASMYVRIIKEIVFTLVKMNSGAASSRLNKVLEVLQVAPSYIGLIVCVVMSFFVESFETPFRIMYALVFASISAIFFNVLSFGRQAIVGLSDAASKGDGSGKNAAMAWVKTKVTLLVMFLCGACFSVGIFVLLLVVTPVMSKPYWCIGVILYFSSVLSVFIFLEVVLEVVHLNAIRRKNKVGTTAESKRTHTADSAVSTNMVVAENHMVSCT